MNATMDANVLCKGVEVVKNLSQVAANLSSAKQATPSETAAIPQKTGDTSQPHTQTAEVKVGGADNGKQEPTVIRETTEQIIYKPFPDGRELSERECEVEKTRLQYNHEEKIKELDFRIRIEEMDARERREREEYDRKERERRREANRRYNRNVLIGAAVFGVAGIGLIAYGLYSDSWNPAHRRLAVPAQQGIELTDAEGTVK